MGKIHYGLQSDLIPEEEDVPIKEPVVWVCTKCGLKVWYTPDEPPKVEDSDCDHEFKKEES